MADQAINPEVERYGAKRAGATVVELEGTSHAVAVSRPKEVADLIQGAVRADPARRPARRSPARAFGGPPGA